MLVCLGTWLLVSLSLFDWFESGLRCLIGGKQIENTSANKRGQVPNRIEKRGIIHLKPLSNHPQTTLKLLSNHFQTTHKGTKP